MASLNSIANNKLIKTEMEGLYVKDIQFSKLKELSDIEAKANEIDQETGKPVHEDGLYELVLWLFAEVLRGEDGTVFEEINSIEDVKEQLSLVQARNIMTSAMASISGGEVGKP